MKGEPILRSLFGNNRAEWPVDSFEKIFVPPRYSSKLESLKPCMLVGGRGTGKTTALQSLKYDLSFERQRREGGGFADMAYLGVVLRINKNQVNAFQGSGRSDAEWQKLFAHYFNLLLCFRLVDLAEWCASTTGVDMSEEDVLLVSSDLALRECVDVVSLKVSLRSAMSKLEVLVNNSQSMVQSEVLLSVAEAPVRSLCESIIRSIDDDGKTIFCCIDEYENLLEYQQAIVNTYIKHASPPLSYKVGVRKYGLKSTQTLDGNDLLRTPDDYGEIDIADEAFDSFAVEVAEKRLQSANQVGLRVPTDLSVFLQTLSFREEAKELGGERVAQEVMSSVKTSCPGLYSELASKDFAEVYFVKYWSEQEGRSFCEVVEEMINSNAKWVTRFDNYKVASLFWLSSGRKGVRIRKYYCGQRTYLALASGNIRFFLELIDQAIGNELSDWAGEGEGGLLTISPRSQTLAARRVGERKLDQLEGLADNGVQLKRLVLAIGKVFFEYARSPIGRTPEVTTFLVEGDSTASSVLRSLLKDGVGHLAIEAFPRTKATTNTELRDNEYRIHPIFCAFFEMSHRKKRRTTFDAATLLKAIGPKPSSAIVRLMGGVEQSRAEELPEQLALFSHFYAE